MKAKKFLMRVFTMAVALLLMLNMGGMTARAKNNNNRVVIWAWGPYVKAVYKAIQIYCEDGYYPIEFEVVEFQSREELEQRLTTAHAAGDPPDIAIVHDSKFPNYVNAGYVAELTQYLNPGDYMNFKVDNVSLNGRMYGIPYDSEPVALYYRKDVADWVNFCFEPNLTWDKFYEFGLSINGESLFDEFYPDLEYLFPVDNSVIHMLMQSAGVSHSNLEGTRDTMQLLNQFYEAGFIDPDNLTSTREELIAKLWGGEFATVIGGPEWVPIITEISEEFMQEWRVTNIPKSEIFTKDVYLGGYSWMVFETANKYQAIDFAVKTFGKSEDLAEMMAEEEFIVPVLLSAQNRLTALAASPYFNSPIYRTDGHVIEFLFMQSQGILWVQYLFYPEEARELIDKFMKLAIQGIMDIQTAYDEFYQGCLAMPWTNLNFLWVIIV